MPLTHHSLSKVRAALSPDQGVYRRLNNVASFEWSTVVERRWLSGRAHGVASHFDAGATVFAAGMMWHRRCDSRSTVDGGAHDPALGSPSADCARVVRDDAVQCSASGRCLQPPGAGDATDAACSDARQSRARAEGSDEAAKE